MNNNYPDNRTGGQNQLPRNGYPNMNQANAAQRQNGAPQQNTGQRQAYPQNGARRSGQIPAQNQPYPQGNAPVRSGNGGNGVPRQNGGSYNPQARQSGAYNTNRPMSATSAAYGNRQPYSSGSAAGRRQRDAMVNRQAAVQGQRREKVRRVKKPFRFNWGVAVFALLCAAVVGVSAWQISRAGWNEDGSAAGFGPVSNAELTERDKTSASGLPDAPEAGETGSTENAAGIPVENAGDAGEQGNASDATSADGEDAVVLVPDEPQPDENAVNLTLYDTVTVDNAKLSEGDLVLVNASHGYSAGDAYVDQLKNAYRDRTGKLKVAATDIGLLPVAFDALERLVIDFEEDTGSHDLLITSGHRTVAEQQEVWDYYLNVNGEEYTNAYVARPGFSEHNTGLACDVSFYTDEGASIPVSEYEHGWWLAANCMREGFICRYPEDKVEITGISNEPWHFRYVGVPHAWICASRNWCLEEYTEGVKAYTADGVMLFVSADGAVSEVNVTDGLPTSGGWLVYYVPKASAGGATDIRVPRGSDYAISGNNADGFVVTVDLR